MNRVLRENFSIRSGYTMRKNIDDYESGDIKVIYAKHLNSINNLELPTIGKVSSEHYLLDGDILLTVKGSFSAVVFDKSIGKAIATSSIMILRPKDKNISSEFIATYLNSMKGQSDLRQIMSGAHVKTINKSELENLRIPIPPLDTQNMIAKLAHNVIDQKNINYQKNEIQQKILDSILIKLTQES